MASHAFLAVDLVMVIKNPFYPKNWRVIKIYAPVSIFGGAFYGIAMAKYYQAADADLKIYNRVRFILNLAIKTIYVLVTVSCNCYSFYRLSRPGISKKTRFQYFIQQLRYSFVGILLSSIYAGYDYYVIITG